MQNNNGEVIDFGDENTGINFDAGFNDLSDVQRLFLLPKVMAKFILAITNPKFAEESRQHPNCGEIQKNIETIKQINPDEFFGNGRFSNLPGEIKNAMLYRILELREDNKLNFQKSFSENIADLLRKYPECPDEVVCKLLKLKLENRVLNVEMDNRHKDFSGNNLDLAQAIINFLIDNKDNITDKQKDMLWGYYAFFNVKQEDIEAIKSKNNIKEAMVYIKNLQEYKNVDVGYENAVMRGILRACNKKWLYKAEYLAERPSHLFYKIKNFAKKCIDWLFKSRNALGSDYELTEEEKIMIVSYLNFGQSETINLCRPTDFVPIFLNKEIDNNKFSIKVRAEIIKNNILGGVFDGVPVAKLIEKIFSGTPVKDGSLKYIPEDMVLALFENAFNIEKNPWYDFGYDFNSLDVNQILDSILRMKDEIKDFSDVNKNQQENYIFKGRYERLREFIGNLNKDSINGYINYSISWLYMKSKLAAIACLVLVLVIVPTIYIWVLSCLSLISFLEFFIVGTILFFITYGNRVDDRFVHLFRLPYYLLFSPIIFEIGLAIVTKELISMSIRDYNDDINAGGNIYNVSALQRDDNVPPLENKRDDIGEVVVDNPAPFVNGDRNNYFGEQL